MQWTPEQYIRRVLVEVALRSGRSVAVVAEEPFALTLWVWGECRQMDREADLAKLAERIDSAGMVAMAFHAPAELQKQEMRYYRQAGQLSTMIDSARDRAVAMVEKLRTATVVGPTN